MLRKGYTSLAVLVAVTLTPTVAWAESLNGNCWRAEEVRAARIQGLKTMLMVDALKCQDTIPATVDSYNSFLSKRHDLVIASRDRVREHFLRLLGPTAGYKAADDYDTRVGNRLASETIDPQRCETTAMFARLATTAADDDLVAMADMLVKSSDTPACASSTAAVVRPTGMVIPVWQQRAPAFARPVPPPESEAATAPVTPVTVTAAAPAPVLAAAPVAPAVVAATPAPIEAVAVVTPAPAFAQPASAPAAVEKLPAAAVADRTDTLKALQAAATALAQIAVTLQSDRSAATPKN